MTAFSCHCRARHFAPVVLLLMGVNACTPVGRGGPPSASPEPSPDVSAPEVATPTGSNPTVATPAGATPTIPPAAEISLEVPVREGWVEEGVASWYGEPFHGRPTASGEVYNMHGATAAHRTLPFGTRIRVENLDSGRTVELRITDRGPFAHDRVLDVSRWGAEALGLVGPGTGRVRITVLEAPAPERCWEVQAGAFREEGNARRLRERLERAGLAARIVRGDEGVILVRAGPFEDRGAADDTAREISGLVVGGC